MNWNKITIPIILLLKSYFALAQCCAGGSGSPIAGGSTQGVLLEGQVELNSNFQYINTTKFLDGSSPTDNFLDKYSSAYSFTRIAYGLTEKLTISLESGYWINKTQIGLNKRDTIASHGFGDFILFPRYSVFSIFNDGKQKELTVGLGIKFPIGSYNDSTPHIEPFSGQTYYTTKPLVMQNSSGATDIVFYSFYYQGYTAQQISFFANAIYIKKGWNPLGEKLGD